MEDNSVLSRINRLVDEERALRARSASEGLSESDQERLRALEVELDQCWDFLRQRRAARSAGRDSDTTAPRDPEVVESYEQ